MKIVNIVPGFGGSFYCGNCLRDSSYVISLIKAGHHAVTIPVYLPLTINHESQQNIPVFYGAINIYLKQKFHFLRKIPKWLESFFNSPFLMKYAAKKAGSTRAHGLEEMTISMLRGHEGYQRDELQQLIDFLKNHEKPDIVHLSNALLLGMAEEIKKNLGIPIVCSLQDEDVWINAMSENYKTLLWDLLSEKAKGVDAFVAVSDFYANVMQKQMNINKEKMHVVHIGVDIDAFTFSKPSMNPPVIGYISRLNEENGLGIVIDAFIHLKSKPEFKQVKLRLSGGMTADDKQFFNSQVHKLKKNNILEDVEFIEKYKEKHLNDYFQPISLLSVPVLNGEAFGLYQIESLACGVPIVQPALGAFPEIVEATKGGITYLPNNAITLSNKWEELLKNPEELIRLGQNGRKNIEQKFNSEVIIQKMLKIYQSVEEKNSFK